MKTYIDMLMVAVITIYIVDLSGFTESWRGLLARSLHVKELRPMKPFDCGLCMTWWISLIYAWIVGELNLYTISWSAILSYLSIPIGQLLIFIKEWLCWLINRLMPRQ